MHRQSTYKFTRKAVNGLLLIAVLIMNISVATAAPSDQIGASSTMVAAHLGHTTDDGFRHQGHGEKCHLFKHLTLRIADTQLVPLPDDTLTGVPVKEEGTGRSTAPPFRPPIF